MKRVVSLSLGSSRRDARVELVLLGEPVRIERIGTDGDYARFRRWLRELDGKVDAIGIGGADLFVETGRRRYYLRDIVRLVRDVRHTPVVDGNGIKHTWERYLVREFLPREVGLSLRGRRVLQVNSVDRYGMAEALAEVGAQVLYGDFLFALGLPIPLRSLRSVQILGALLLPVISRLPFRWFYPTGEKQERRRPRFGWAFRWAEVVCGDFHYIRRYMPRELPDRVVLTQTVTPEDVEDLRQRGVALLVTTGPELGGRSFATNVLQALVVAFAGKDPETITPEEYMTWMHRFGFRPRVSWLNAPRSDPLRRVWEAARSTPMER
ncbi:MAG: quinate 5-dehydrogenase [Armatimonadota bacterium]|nr:quinate 5-dehydrogenase [Armatimonadota bacterium]MDR7442996.1 quinate 5-dehydrogenase [Armatimonadota bacterium]MDR7569400.1 quinate 5-dehydrogenase [Armatimonadota bacterium]MDR7614549.1 quinate 5-dehydrogenase [Armatimonadota bacterium]